MSLLVCLIKSIFDLLFFISIECSQLPTLSQRQPSPPPHSLFLLECLLLASCLPACLLQDSIRNQHQSPLFWHSISVRVCVPYWVSCLLRDNGEKTMVMHALANLPALYRVPVWLASLLSVSFFLFFDLAISETAAAIWRWRGKGCASLFFTLTVWFMDWRESLLMPSLLFSFAFHPSLPNCSA